jgi:hypothetical protein
MLIPTAQIKIYADLGFRLVDEPGCALARVFAGDVRRVPKKIPAKGGKARPVKSELHNAGHTRRARSAQGA